MAKTKVDNKLNVVIGTKSQITGDTTIPENAIVIVTDENEQALNVEYNNTTSGLDVDNIQDAIDETINMIGNVETALVGKANATHSHTKSDITDFPTSIPPAAHNHDSEYYKKSETYSKEQTDALVGNLTGETKELKSITAQPTGAFVYGDLYYNSSTKGLYYYTGSVWELTGVGSPIEGVIYSFNGTLYFWNETEAELIQVGGGGGGSYTRTFLGFRNGDGDVSISNIDSYDELKVKIKYWTGDYMAVTDDYKANTMWHSFEPDDLEYVPQSPPFQEYTIDRKVSFIMLASVSGTATTTTRLQLSTNAAKTTLTISGGSSSIDIGFYGIRYS